MLLTFDITRTREAASPPLRTVKCCQGAALTRASGSMMGVRSARLHTDIAPTAAGRSREQCERNAAWWQSGPDSLHYIDIEQQKREDDRRRVLAAAHARQTARTLLPQRPSRSARTIGASCSAR